MKKGLIGYTGFVGGNLLRQTSFNYLFNSRNIQSIAQCSFDLLVCAAPSAVKWKANQFPEEDKKMIEGLIGNLAHTKAKTVVYISTIDTYKNPVAADEDSVMETEDLHPYGKHRLELERFFQDHFRKVLIVRLPALFGLGLKKNFIYDLMNNNRLDLTHKDSQFQYYYLNDLWGDIQIALKNNISLINFNSEPISAEEVAMREFGMSFTTVTEKLPVYYNIKTKYGYLYSGTNEYMYTKEQILNKLQEFLSVSKNG